jgi:hypothetical protein
MVKMKILLIGVLVILMGGICEVQADGMTFNDRMGYDIYFSTGTDNSTVVKNVTIVRTEEIAGKVFLVVRDQGFKLKVEEGFILLDAVVAIFPERSFRVQSNQKIDIQH